MDYDELRDKIDREAERYIDPPDVCTTCGGEILPWFLSREMCPECMDLLLMTE